MGRAGAHGRSVHRTRRAPPTARLSRDACYSVGCLVLALAGCQGAPEQTPAATTTMASVADEHPDLSGRWVVSGRRGGGGGIMVIEPDGHEVEFATFGDYQDALASGTVSPSARIVGRRPNYRHGNNVYAERDGGMSQRFTANPPLYKPEYWEQVRYLDINGNVEDMTFICLPAGVPRMGPPIRILQTANDVVLLYQQRNTWRVVPTDGRDHDPINAEDQTFLGDAVGRWEGDTLVVQTNNLRGAEEGPYDGWLDVRGTPYSGQATFTERFHRPTFGKLEIDVTVEDAKAFTRPFTVRINQRVVADEEPIEFVCNENQQFRRRIKID